MTKAEADFEAVKKAIEKKDIVPGSSGHLKKLAALAGGQQLADAYKAAHTEYRAASKYASATRCAT